MHICFLDIDGTLVLTGGAGKDAFCYALAEGFGAPPTARDVAFAGRSDRAIAQDLFAIHGIEPTIENWHRFAALYVRWIDKLLAERDGYVLPGVVALLDALAARGDVALGLITGNVRDAARHKLRYYGLWDRFAFGGFGDQHTERNDIAAAAMAAARHHLNGQPDTPGRPIGQVVVIGDTLNDVRCARSIGARSVAVPTGHTPADVLRTARPDVLVNTLEDAAPILQLFDLADPQQTKPQRHREHGEDR
jgi:phosphoglycolate phosphatase